MTAMERALWHRIRREQLGYKFRRQYPAGPFILDFFSPELRLCVEVDGPFHDARKDEIRDAYLLKRGIVTWRVSSFDVFQETDAMVEALLLRCKMRDSELAGSETNLD